VNTQKIIKSSKKTSPFTAIIVILALCGIWYIFDNSSNSSNNSTNLKYNTNNEQVFNNTSTERTTDPIVNCQINPNCGGGTKQMRQSECNTLVCCQIGSLWYIYPDSTSCSQAQQEYINSISQPVVNITPSTSTSSYICNCSKTCPQMSSCEEAYYQLNICGCSKRDGDNDGVPCENICPGG
jgi:hypothetical protein